MNRWTRRALLIGAIGWGIGGAVVLAFPQFPDGDSTAQAQFVAWYGTAWQYYVRSSWLWNLAGAVFAWGVVGAGLTAWRTRAWRRAVVAAVSLLLWGGWAVNQTIGWQGELFLTPDGAVPLSDSQTVIAFDHFLIPPAPDGAGRALQMRLTVNGQPYTIDQSTPYRGNGWSVTPRWYGAVVTHPLRDEPLYIGGSGTQEIALNDGQRVKLTIRVETLELSSEPRVDGWTIRHYAIVGATYAPFPFFPGY